MYEVISFWLTYLIGGYLLDGSTTDNNPQLYRTLGVNALLSFALIPITENIPTLIIVPNTFVGYLIRISIAILIGDLWLYLSHRLLHHRWFYRFHKQHHTYTAPHALTGLYAHPVEYILSNHLSMMIPLKIISLHTLAPIESAVVALDILISHTGRNNNHPSAKYHTLHHERHNCNYSFAYVSDMLFGTYVSE